MAKPHTDAPPCMVVTNNRGQKTSRFYLTGMNFETAKLMKAVVTDTNGRRREGEAKGHTATLLSARLKIKTPHPVPAMIRQTVEITITITNSDGDSNQVKQQAAVVDEEDLESRRRTRLSGPHAPAGRPGRPGALSARP